MRRSLIARNLTRRRILGGLGQGALLMPLLGSRLAKAAVDNPLCTPNASDCELRLVATDGAFALPGRTQADSATVPGQPLGPLYGFGFIQGEVGQSIAELVVHKGLVRWPAPIIAVDETDALFITLTNIGFQFRPDLDDAHTIHWHGFRNPISVFDGVPEVSVAVPPARDFPYFFPPRKAGTYMYHCHFEDVEHVQLGMDGVVFVRPAQNNTAPGTLFGSHTHASGDKYAYNDGNGSTFYEREFTLLLNEVDPRPHDNLLGIQEFLWSDYKAVYWLINGRAYPHTLIRNGDALGEAALLVNEDPTGQQGPDGTQTLRQPVSSLIQVNAGERALLRFVNLGYDQQSMQLNGIPMRVVGEDATLLRGPGGADLSYLTNTIYLGPGESRDVLFTAPAFSGSGTADPAPGMAGAFYDSYLLKNRNVHTLHNNGATVNGLGGQVTEVWVYNGTLPAQTAPNQTYISLS